MFNIQTQCFSENPVNSVKKSPVATFDYNVTGQIASATRGTQTENFLWDGLALIHRDGVNYLNEPHAGGGAPVLASGGRASSRAETILFNDLLGTTVGSLGSDDTFTSSSLTTYGEDSPLSKGGGRGADGGLQETFFTGKPHVAGLGHAFLLRNYRSDLGKWQTADPLGYPDGLNNFAYCNGRVTDCVDWLGAEAWYLQYVGGIRPPQKGISPIVDSSNPLVDYRIEYLFTTSVSTKAPTESITVYADMVVQLQSKPILSSTWSPVTTVGITFETIYTIDSSGFVIITGTPAASCLDFNANSSWQREISAGLATVIPSNTSGDQFNQQFGGRGGFQFNNLFDSISVGEFVGVSFSFTGVSYQTPLSTAAITIAKIKE